MESLPPHHPLTDDTGKELARAISRLSYVLSYAVETYNRDTKKGEPSEAPLGPTLYTDDAYMRFPPVARRVSWHQRVRAKKVSLPAATGWSLLGVALTELARLILSGQIHF